MTPEIISGVEYKARPKRPEIIFFLMFSIKKNFKNPDSRSSGRFPLKNRFVVI